jgi:hypothetical protein
LSKKEKRYDNTDDEIQPADQLGNFADDQYKDWSFRLNKLGKKKFEKEMETKLKLLKLRRDKAMTRKIKELKDLALIKKSQKLDLSFIKDTKLTEISEELPFISTERNKTQRMKFDYVKLKDENDELEKSKEAET